jgi:hypothetical protein
MTMEHIQLTTFQTMSSTEFDQTVLNSVIQEINQIIKDNMMEFRLTFELIADSLEAKLYKNAITGYYINKGFKIVNYLGFIYIDWSHPNVHINKPTSPLYNVLNTTFTAEELYLYITSNNDYRFISYRILKYYVDQEIKAMKILGQQESIITIGLSSTLSTESLNKMFAPELLKINDYYPDVELTFTSGGLFKIILYTIHVLYTDLSYEILFGTRRPF